MLAGMVPARVVWEAINSPLTSSMRPPHHPLKLISGVKKASGSHSRMNKSSSFGPKEDLCHAGLMRLNVSGGALASESLVHCEQFVG